MKKKALFAKIKSASGQNKRFFAQKKKLLLRRFLLFAFFTAYVKYIYHGSNNMVSEAKNCQKTGNFSFLQPDHWTSDKKI